MSKDRLEAFSDGVIAIIITIMVLELHAPEHATWAALLPLWPVFLSYVLSFIYLGIYWNNHHHLLQAIKHVDGRVLWANMHLLFWLSLIPFVTAWMGQNRFDPEPVALYGVVLLVVGGGLLHSDQGPSLSSRPGLGTSDSSGKRLQGEDFSGNLSGRYSAFVCGLMAGLRVVCSGRNHVARARPSH